MATTKKAPTKPATKAKPSTTKKPEHDDSARYKIIIEKGEAQKLNPHSDSKVFFTLAFDNEQNVRCVKITGNDSGGLHTKEWIPLDKVITLLEGHKGKPFKSTALKPCIVGKSSNNPSFLAAILRALEISLIQASEGSPYQHILSNTFEESVAALSGEFKN